MCIVVNAYCIFLVHVMEMMEDKNCVGTDCSSSRWEWHSPAPMQAQRHDKAKPVEPIISDQRFIKIASKERLVDGTVRVQCGFVPLLVQAVANSEDVSAAQGPDSNNKTAFHSEHSYAMKQTPEALTSNVLDLQQKLDECRKLLRRSQQNYHYMSRKVCFVYKLSINNAIGILIF